MVSGGQWEGAAIQGGAQLVSTIADAFGGDEDKTPNAFFDKNKWLAMALMKARMNMKPRQFSALPQMPGSYSDQGNAAALAQAQQNNQRSY